MGFMLVETDYSSITLQSEFFYDSLSANDKKVNLFL
jgi:hypothetical protein